MFGKKKKKKEFIKAAFSKYIPKEKMDQLLETSNPVEVNKLKKLEINFLYVNVLESLIVDNPELFEQIVNICLKHGIVDFFSNIIVVYQNMMDSLPRQSLEPFIQELDDNVGNQISYIYGNENCLIGNYGSNNTMRFSAIMPDIDKKLEILFSLNKGEKAAI